MFIGKVILLLVVWASISALLKIYFINKKPNCPKCGSSIGRIARKFGDRLLGKVFLCKIRRYSCDNCGWEGLKYKRAYSVKKVF